MVYDESGAPIRQVEGTRTPGFQRAAWDLRYPAGQIPKKSDGDEDFFPDAADQGPLVLAGTYSVRMFEQVAGAVTEMARPSSSRLRRKARRR